MDASSINHRSGKLDPARWSVWQVRTLAIVAAIVVNVIILIVGRVVDGRFPVAKVGSNDQTIGFAQVIFVTVLAGLVGWGLLALLERRTRRATAIWAAIAVVVFLLSLLAPLGSGVNTSSKVVLACMHIGAAATIIPLMLRSATMRG